MAQLRHGLRLDLADALTCHPVDLTDLIEGAGLTVREAETQSHNTGLSLGERLEHGLKLILQQRERHSIDRDDSFGVLDEVAELLSPSSPMVWSSEMGSRAYCWISSTFSGVISISFASSSGVARDPNPGAARAGYGRAC